VKEELNKGSNGMEEKEEVLEGEPPV